jgi:hypothetical protein
MEADPDAVDIIFLACQRKLTAESMGNIPASEQPTYEELAGYAQTSISEPNIAWTDRYPELCMWMTDYENNRKRKERDNDRSTGFGSDSIMNGRFDFKR